MGGFARFALHLDAIYRETLVGCRAGLRLRSHLRSRLDPNSAAHATWLAVYPGLRFPGLSPLRVVV